MERRVSRTSDGEAGAMIRDPAENRDRTAVAQAILSDVSEKALRSHILCGCYSLSRVVMDSMADWIDTSEAKAFQRRYTIVLSIIALIAWMIALYGVANAPWVPDLYNLLNPGSNHKAENTLVYLCIGPIMLTFASLAGWLAPDYFLSQMPKKKGPALLSSLFGGSCFVFALLALTIYRVHNVLVSP
jgi:uncharacterized membrane protein YhdT